jgi:hypothetical protein
MKDNAPDFKGRWTNMKIISTQYDTRMINSFRNTELEPRYSSMKKIIHRRRSVTPCFLHTAEIKLS